MQPFDFASAERAAAAVPQWVQELRREGYAHFERLDMPSSREEIWKYVDLDFSIDDFGLPEEPGAVLDEDAAVAATLGTLAGKAMIVDGTTTAITNDSSEAVFSGLAAAVHEHEGLVRGAYGQMIDPGADKFAAAHRAYSTDGIFLYVPAGVTVAEPFYVEIQASDGASFPHITVVVEDNAEASLVLNLRSPAGAPVLIVPQVEASVRDAARFKLVTIQGLGYGARAVGHQRMVVGRDATAWFGEIGIGSRFSRLVLDMDCYGQGSSAQVVGAYFGEEHQVLDYRYRVNHVGTNTRSDMFLKGAVEDQAQSVFTGMIHIEPGAQKTGAYQTNKNLVLAEGARAQSVPNLEILANDVRCSHGSTVTPLDDEQRYYLMSRGLDQRRADRLQVQGFFEEALSRLPIPGMAGPLRERIIGKFVSAQEEGRV